MNALRGFTSLSILCLLLASSLHAQNVVKAEFFIDTDNGFQPGHAYNRNAW